MKILNGMFTYGKVRLNDKNIWGPIGITGKTLEHYISEKSEIINQLKKPSKKKWNIDWFIILDRGKFWKIRRNSF